MGIKHRQTSRSRAKYECDMCGKIDHWSNNWFWYGSMKQLDQMYEGSKIITVCSNKCREKHEQGNEPILGR